MKNKLKHKKPSKDKYTLKLVYSKWHSICNYQTSFCHRSKFTKSDIINLTNKLNSYKTHNDRQIFLSSLIFQGKSEKTKEKTTPIYALQKQNGDMFRVCYQIFLNVLGIGKELVQNIINKKNEFENVYSDQQTGKGISDYSLDIQNEICEHIQSFPTIDSRYNKEKEKTM